MPFAPLRAMGFRAFRAVPARELVICAEGGNDPSAALAKPCAAGSAVAVAFVDAAPRNARRYIAIVPDSDLLTRTVDIPAVSLKERDAVVRHQVDGTLPGRLEDLDLRTTVVGETSDGLHRVLVECVRRDRIDASRDRLEAAPGADLVLQRESWGWAHWIQTVSKGHEGRHTCAVLRKDRTVVLVCQRGIPLYATARGAASNDAETASHSVAELVGRASAALPDETSGNVDLVVFDDQQDSLREAGVRIASTHAARLVPGPDSSTLLCHHAAAGIARSQVPDRRRGNNRIASGVRAALALGLVALALAASWFVADLYRMSAETERLRAARSESQPLVEELRQLRETALANASTEAKQQPDAVDALVAIAEAAPSDARLTTMQLSPGGRVALSGSSARIASAVAFAESLRAEPGLRAIDLERLQNAPSQRVDFQITGRWETQSP